MAASPIRGIARSCALRRSSTRSRLLANIADRPHFDTPHRSRRDLRGELDSLVQVTRLEQVKARELFLRLREGAVADREPAVAHAHGRSGRDRLERLRCKA